MLGFGTTQAVQQFQQSTECLIRRRIQQTLQRRPEKRSGGCRIIGAGRNVGFLHHHRLVIASYFLWRKMRFYNRSGAVRCVRDKERNSISFCLSARQTYPEANCGSETRKAVSIVTYDAKMASSEDPRSWNELSTTQDKHQRNDPAQEPQVLCSSPGCSLSLPRNTAARVLCACSVKIVSAQKQQRNPRLTTKQSQQATLALFCLDPKKKEMNVRSEVKLHDLSQSAGRWVIRFLQRMQDNLCFVTLSGRPARPNAVLLASD